METIYTINSHKLFNHLEQHFRGLIFHKKLKNGTHEIKTASIMFDKIISQIEKKNNITIDKRNCQ